METQAALGQSIRIDLIIVRSADIPHNIWIFGNRNKIEPIKAAYCSNGGPEIAQGST